jgi:hypothetical protein
LNLIAGGRQGSDGTSELIVGLFGIPGVELANSLESCEAGAVEPASSRVVGRVEADVLPGQF